MSLPRALPTDSSTLGKKEEADSLDNPPITYKEGKVVCVGRNFVWEVMPRKRSLICYRCLLDPNPDGSHVSRCSGCRWAHYCSAECQKMDWKDRHKAECKLLQQPEVQSHRDMDMATCAPFCILVLKAIIQLKKDGPGSDFHRLPILPIEQHVQGTYNANRRLIRLFDPEGTVCPDLETYSSLWARVSQNFALVSTIYQGPGGARLLAHGSGLAALVVQVFPQPVTASRNCEANAVLSVAADGVPLSVPWPVQLTAVRDIYEGEEICSQQETIFCTKALRIAYRRHTEGPTMVCSCRLCVDEHLEADRCALKCKNSRCAQAIPSDERALQPCPKCGEMGNGARLEESQALMKRMAALYPKDYYVGPTNNIVQFGRADMMRALILLGEKVLHPTNIPLGMLYHQMSYHLQMILQDNDEEWLNYVKNAHLNKYDDILLRVHGKIVRCYVGMGKVKEAIPHAKILLERSKIIPGAGSGPCQLYELLWKNLTHKPKPIIDEVMLLALNRG